MSGSRACAISTIAFHSHHPQTRLRKPKPRFALVLDDDGLEYLIAVVTCDLRKLKERAEANPTIHMPIRRRTAKKLVKKMRALAES